MPTVLVRIRILDAHNTDAADAETAAVPSKRIKTSAKIRQIRVIRVLFPYQFSMRGECATVDEKWPAVGYSRMAADSVCLIPYA